MPSVCPHFYFIASVLPSAVHLGMAKEDFIVAYLKRDEEEGGYRIKTSPCPFLGDDYLCRIYDVRPEKCQSYPFTDKGDFVFRIITHANKAVVCPAVFYLVEQMKRRLRRLGWEASHTRSHGSISPATTTNTG